MPTIFRAGRGLTLWSRAKPETAQKKLELFSYENNPVSFLLFFEINNSFVVNQIMKLMECYQDTSTVQLFCCADTQKHLMLHYTTPCELYPNDIIIK